MLARPRISDPTSARSSGTVSKTRKREPSCAAADVESCSARIEACVVRLRRMADDCRTGRDPRAATHRPSIWVAGQAGEPACEAAHALIRQCAAALGRVM